MYINRNRTGFIKIYDYYLNIIPVNEVVGKKKSLLLVFDSRGIDI